MKKYEFFILAFLFLYGFFLRIFNLGFQSLWIDESFSINASLAVLRSFYPVLESGFVYSGYLLHTYLVAGLFLIFGVSEFIARLPSVFFGSFVIVLVYLLARYLFNWRVALLSAVFVCFSSLEIGWSRQARSYIILQFVFLVGLLLFFYFVRTKSLKWLYYSVVVAFVGFLVHPFSLFLFLVYFFYLAFNYKQCFSVFDRKQAVFFAILMACVVFLFFLQHGLFSFVYYLGYYFGYLRSDFFAVFYFGVLGALFSLKRFRESSFLVLAFVIPLLIVSFFIYLVHFRYLFFVLPVLFVFCALFIDAFSSFFGRFYVVVFSLLVFVVLFSGFVFIPKSEYVLEPLTPQPDFKKAYDNLEVSIDDVVVSSHPTITSFYLGRPDYALEYSLSGKKEGSVRYKDGNFERYLGVEIAGYEKLIDIAKNNNGYIIIDSLATNTMEPEILSFVSGLELVDEASIDGDWFVKAYRF